MRRAFPLALLVLTGCASTPPGSALPGRDETARVTDASGNALRFRPGEAAARTTLAVPRDAAWRVLPAVYDSLGIPVTLIDPATHTFGNSGFTLTRRLGKTSLTQYIDCGQTQGFASAETYEIYLGVMTQLHPGPDPGTTVMATSVDAAGRPMTFQGGYTRCSSKGELEKRIAERMGAAVNR